MAIATRSTTNANKKRARAEESVDEDAQPLSGVPAIVPSSKKAKATHNNALSLSMNTGASSSSSLLPVNLEENIALRRLADELSVGSSEEQERVSFVRALTAACECADDYARVIRLVQDLQADIRNKHLTPPAPTAVAAEVEFVEELLSPAVAASSTLRRKRARDVVEDKEDSEMVPSKRIRFGKGPERHMQPPPDLPVVPHRRRRIVPDVDRDVEKDVERDAEGIIVNFRESTVMQALRLVKQRPQKAKKIAAEPHMDSVSTVGTSSRPAWTEEERKGWAGALENAKEKGKGKGKGKKATSDSEEVVKGFALVNGFNLEHEEDYEPDTFDSQSMCSVAGSVDEDRADRRKAIGN